MKILIVDDDNRKIVQVVSVIKEAIDFAEIDTVIDIISAKKKINKIKYDLLIIDLVVPLREDLEPDNLAGCNLIDEIQRSNSLKSPKYIVGLTQYEQRKLNFSRIWVALTYSASSVEWKEILGELIHHINKSASVSDDQPNVTSQTIFVEGITDEKVIREALRIFFPDQYARVVVRSEGGVNLVVKKLLVWAFSMPRTEEGKNIKSIGLLDGDKAGIDARREFSTLVKNDGQKGFEFCKIYNLNSTYAKEAVQLMKRGIKFGVCLEDLIPPQYLMIAKEKGWMQIRTIEDPRDWDKHHSSLSQFIESLNLKENENIYLYSIKREYKELFCDYILSLSETERKTALRNFEQLLSEILKYLVVLN